MLSALLDRTMDHQRQTASKDAIGGNVPTWAVQNDDEPVAVWSAGSATLRTFLRRDIEGTHVIATARDLSATTKDRFYDGTVYYTVNGVERFTNTAITAETLYLHDVTVRTV